MKRTFFVVLFGLLVGSTGCYAPSIDEGQFTCVTSDKCPSGWRCHCQQCVPANSATNACPMDLATEADLSIEADLGTTDLGTTDLVTHDLVTLDLLVVDMASSSDLTIVPDLGAALPCSNGGVRAPRDPGLAALALCPAAWKVAGISNTAGRMTPCNRAPTANGTNGAGIDCSAEDNCGVGWHVCENEAEVGAKGLTVTACSALDDATNLLWITRQKGAPPPPETPGPPICDGTTNRTLFGCGGSGNTISSTCTIFRRALLESPNAGDQCSDGSSGAFTCEGVNMTTGEAFVVKKPALAGGGVMCCRD